MNERIGVSYQFKCIYYKAAKKWSKIIKNIF